MSLHEDFVVARNLIAKPGGFIKDSFNDGRGGYCVRGALLNAVSGGVGSMSLEAIQDHERLFMEINKLPQPRVFREPPAYIVATWNNQPERTQQEVVTAFDKCIAVTAPEPAVPDLEEIVSVA